MWRDLTQLPSLLTELIGLTREQNSLLREFLAASGRRSTTPITPRSTPRSTRIRTEQDIHRYSPADYARDRQQQAEKLQAPHRDPMPRPVNPHPTNPNPLSPETLDPAGGSGPTADPTP